jgi:acyl-CoA thioesterase-1
MKRRTFIHTASLTGLGLMLAPEQSWAMKDLPRVLLLGDSISIGYTPFVQELLKGTMEVTRPMNANGRFENCQGTMNGVKHLDRWLEAGNWDLIHFNFGLHDLKRVEPDTGKNSKNVEDPKQSEPRQYRKNLKEIAKRLKATDAKLIFATTTPYPPYPAGPLREPGLSEVYNEVALKIMRQQDIPVNDLYHFVLPRMKELMQPNNVHFTIEGSAALAQEVVRHIKLIMQT